MPLLPNRPMSDQEIVDATETLARFMLRHIGAGYEVPVDYVFHRNLKNPRAARAWEAACDLMDIVRGADVQSALDNLDPDVVAPPAVAKHRVTLELELTSVDDSMRPTAEPIDPTELPQFERLLAEGLITHPGYCPEWLAGGAVYLGVKSARIVPATTKPLSANA
jgi:hypothetical protein